MELLGYIVTVSLTLYFILTPFRRELLDSVPKWPRHLTFSPAKGGGSSGPTFGGIPVVLIAAILLEVKWSLALVCFAFL
jgi:hypothetical protein